MPDIICQSETNILLKDDKLSAFSKIFVSDRQIISGIFWYFANKFFSTAMFLKTLRIFTWIKSYREFFRCILTNWYIFQFVCIHILTAVKITTYIIFVIYKLVVCRVENIYQVMNGISKNGRKVVITDRLKRWRIFDTFLQ